ncbi:trypsin-like peptidase domain-containing protein [Actinacidiphila acididurans]|uniref:Trypsin-like peptidase domain-containing protein n=1 Tax=Actinacidiphila acididurans TaxID=2784346 RepID=A0ABS2U2X8_9ACTN|nr:trypsin-like peptidase domain-containing protein [Actinacidiphila acididurans]MBM9509392.1 trypsin-like peptidase domain-containing protein [Actinacidiphila acididurans]
MTDGAPDKPSALGRSRGAGPDQPGLDPHRIAEVIVADGGGRRGSGYRVTATAVLTAAHVVVDAMDLQVRFDVDRPGQWAVPGTVAWIDPSTDVAVVTITPVAESADVAPAVFGRVRDDRHAVIGVHAAGFPLWKQRIDREGRPFRELHQADGTVAALSNLRTGTLEITVAPAGVDPDANSSPWAGMSGAALWAGYRIVGVIAEHHRFEGTGRLTAVRIDHAIGKADGAGREALCALLGIGARVLLPDAEAPPPSGSRPARAGVASDTSDAMGGILVSEDAPPPRGTSRIVGLPVAHGLELFKNRSAERDLIGRHLADPAVRVVTVTGRRGIGKSAVAAKVMEALERGGWPGSVQAPPPAGLINLSTRTSGISLERIYLDCAHLLGAGQEARLLNIWATNRTIQEKVRELIEAMGDQLFVILLDNLEDRLEDDGRPADEELAVFFDSVFRARSTPRLLITSQVPLLLAPELRRFAAEVEMTEGLPPTDSVALLRELDRAGSLGVSQLTDSQLLQAAVRVHGVPRALELLVGAMADDTVTLPTLQEVLEDFTLRGDVVAGLAQDRYRRLDPPSRAVLNVLAVLRTQATREALTWIMAGLDPAVDVPAVLSHLLRVHMLSVDRPSRTFALHPMDADLAYDEMPWSGASGRQAVERRVAQWYAGIAPPREEWRSLDDVRSYRREFDHLVLAGDFDRAATVLGTLSEWMVWQGSTISVISMHMALDGKLQDDRARLAHALGYAHARLNAGPLADAAELFAAASELARQLDDRPAVQVATFGLGDAYRQMGRLDAAADPLARAAELAHELDDFEREVHALLSLSLTHSYMGQGTRALAGADRLRDLARGSGDMLTEARSWNARSIALLVLGRWQEAIEAADRSLGAYQDAGSREATTYALNARGVALTALGRVPEALRALGAALDDASQMENPRAEGVCLYNMAWAHWTGAEYDQAAQTAERAARSLHIAGAVEAAAAQALAEAARAQTIPDPTAAADALIRAADAIGNNAEMAGRASAEVQAQQLLNSTPDGR